MVETERERLYRALGTRKIGSWRLTELLDDDVVDALGLTHKQVLEELLRALDDFKV